MSSSSWRTLIDKACRTTGDRIENMFFTLTSAELDRAFDTGYGGEEGVPFTAWSDDWVYFPVCYDGAEWVGYVPRNPCSIKTKHWGG